MHEGQPVSQDRKIEVISRQISKNNKLKMEQKRNSINQRQGATYAPKINKMSKKLKRNFQTLVDWGKRRELGRRKMSDKLKQDADYFFESRSNSYTAPATDKILQNSIRTEYRSRGVSVGDWLYLQALESNRNKYLRAVESEHLKLLKMTPKLTKMGKKTKSSYLGNIKKKSSLIHAQSQRVVTLKEQLEIER